MASRVSSDITVQLRHPLPSQVVQIHGKKYRITNLSLRNSIGQKWESVDPTQHSQHLDLIAKKCGELFEKINTQNGSSPKEITLTFELKSKGVFASQPNSILLLKKIEYVSPTSSKKETVEIDIEAYSLPDQACLKETLDHIRPVLTFLFMTHAHRAPKLTLPSNTSGAAPASTNSLSTLTSNTSGAAPASTNSLSTLTSTTSGAAPASTDSLSTLTSTTFGAAPASTGDILAPRTSSAISDRNQELIWESSEATQQYHVGVLGSKWQFPSDHLPVGAEIDGIRMISWNVLNTEFINWITDKNTQGLKGSMIETMNQKLPGSDVTRREMAVIDLIKKMFDLGDLIALQECGQPFIDELNKFLPPKWKLIKSYNEKTEDQIIILYNKGVLTYHATESNTILNAYTSGFNKPIQKAVFTNQKNGKKMCVINAHIPGDPASPARQEFANYVKTNSDSQATTVALGDANFERNEMLTAYQNAGFDNFKLHSPWNTNVGTNKCSKAIDHIFVKNATQSRNLTPSKILPTNSNLKQTIEQLNP